MVSNRGPGWFREEHDPSQLRYWDGRRWTDFRLHAPTEAPAVARSWPRRHPVLVGLLALVLLAAFASMMGPGGSDGDDQTASDPPVATPAPESSATPTPRPSPTTPPTVAAPPLVGRGLQSARSTLQDADLRVQVKRRISDQRPGTVLRQSSRPGQEIAPGSAVTLVVSAPWPRVPGVEGLSTRGAISRLTQAGFLVQTVERTVSRGRDAVVLSQATSAGRAVKPSSTIRLVVANLRTPPPAPAPNCATGYSPCLTPMSDYDCAGGSGDGPGYAQGPITVTGSDPYDLDSENDGTACE